MRTLQPAALLSVWGFSRYNPIKTIKTSFIGTMNMLGLAKRTKARFLLTSTSEVYGDPLVHPQVRHLAAFSLPSCKRCCQRALRRTLTIFSCRAPIIVSFPARLSAQGRAPNVAYQVWAGGDCTRISLTVWLSVCLAVHVARSTALQVETYFGNVNPIGERSCYDEGKRAAETLTFDYMREHGLEVGHHCAVEGLLL